MHPPRCCRWLFLAHECNARACRVTQRHACTTSSLQCPAAHTHRFVVSSKSLGLTLMPLMPARPLLPGAPPPAAAAAPGPPPPAAVPRILSKSRRSLPVAWSTSRIDRPSLPPDVLTTLTQTSWPRCTASLAEDKRAAEMLLTCTRPSACSMARCCGGTMQEKTQGMGCELGCVQQNIMCSAGVHAQHSTGMSYNTDTEHCMSNNNNNNSSKRILSYTPHSYTRLHGPYTACLPSFPGA